MKTARRFGLWGFLWVIGVWSASLVNAAESDLLHNTFQPYQGTPADVLRTAAFSGNCPEIQRLLARGVDIDRQDEDGNTPLSWAQLGDRPEAVKLLLDKGAELDRRDSAGYTVLHQAAMAGREAVMKILLERGANANTQDRKGWTPLMDAAAYGRAGAVELLLASGADPNAMNRQGDTPLSLSQKNGHPHVAMMLLANGADPEAQTKQLYTDLARMDRSRRGPVRVRLAGHFRTRGAAEAFCSHDLSPQGGVAMGNAILSQDAAVTNTLVRGCQGMGEPQREERGFPGLLPGNRGTLRTVALSTGDHSGVASRERLLREFVSVWEEVRGRYPDMDRRLREFSDKGRASGSSADADLLRRALALWETLARETPDLPRWLLNLAGGTNYFGRH